jgi:hypothetical protein
MELWQAASVPGAAPTINKSSPRQEVRLEDLLQSRFYLRRSGDSERELRGLRDPRSTYADEFTPDEYEDYGSYMADSYYDEGSLLDDGSYGRESQNDGFDLYIHDK